YFAIVLWFLACGDSLQALAGRLERRVRRSAQRRGRFALRWDRSRTAARARVSGRFGSRRYFVGALAGAAVAGLTAVAVLGTRVGLDAAGRSCAASGTGGESTPNPSACAVAVTRSIAAAALGLALFLMLTPTAAASTPTISYSIDGIPGTNGWYRGSSHGDNV